MDTLEPFRRRQPRESDGTRGFGLIEIVVAMFLLAIVTLAVLPLLVQGLKLSASNATVAAASQLANQQVELLRSKSLCGDIAPATTTATAQGVVLQISRTVGTTCPLLGYPITVPVSVSVTRMDTSAEVATVNTLIFVTGP
jgi:prepilin-type N-terminal cleavage/methylation domain-containing protein